jgi:hypothetical protein
VDDFAGGVDPAIWTYSQTLPGLYSMDDSQGDVRFAIVGHNPGGLQAVGLTLNLAALTPSWRVSGDFDMTVDFSDAVIPGPGVDQVELHAFFASGHYFFNVRDYYNVAGGSTVHVWDGGWHWGFPTDATDGTLRISRTGDVVAGFLDDVLVWSAPFTASDMVMVQMTLQNNLSSDDRTSVTFDNFSLRAAGIPDTAIPEPATCALLALGALAALARKRRVDA